MNSSVTAPSGRPGGRASPLVLGRQPCTYRPWLAQPRHILLRVVPTHARHRMAIRLSKTGVSPRVALNNAETSSARTPAGRRRECPILADRHFVAPSASRPPGMTTISGHSSQSRNISPRFLMSFAAGRNPGIRSRRCRQPRLDCRWITPLCRAAPTAESARGREKPRSGTARCMPRIPPGWCCS